MSLADDIRATLPELQAAAESLMGATFAVYRPTGTAVVDGLKVQQYESRAATPGKIQAGGSSARDTGTRTVKVGATTLRVLEGGLHLPIGAEVPRAGDRGVGWEYQCTAVAAGTDQALFGRRFLVVEVPVKTYATARRLDVVEVSVP